MHSLGGSGSTQAKLAQKHLLPPQHSMYIVRANPEQLDVNPIPLSSKIGHASGLGDIVPVPAMAPVIVTFILQLLLHHVTAWSQHAHADVPPQQHAEAIASELLTNRILLL
mgnify:FL=1